eukprot:TRINITY_DN3263_c0_g1_i1.p1 TRINITY_DN3263_c0_g1~~TRINITY_DN3263_c0_g1_i1.p1  ORF type:complete len:318 (-),score=86.20 TRINITY_DN3263_c0_g1_i1:142-1005(-)
MFNELNNGLNWEAEKFFPRGAFVLVQDEAASTSRAEFLPLHFLLMNLKTNRNACFISLDTSPPLLVASARKTGVNLQHYEANRSLFVVDAFSEPFTWAKEEDSKTSSAATTASNTKYRVSFETNPTPGVSTTHNPLKAIYDSVKEVIHEVELKALTSSKQQLCLIIDNLNLLPTFCSTAQILEFVSQLRSLCASSVDKAVELYLVVLIHADEEEDRCLVAQLSHLADLIIYSKSFRSGYLVDVDGELSFHCKNKPNPFEANAPLPSALHFKTTETTVRVFAPGSKDL